MMSSSGLLMTMNYCQPSPMPLFLPSPHLHDWALAKPGYLDALHYRPWTELIIFPLPIPSTKNLQIYITTAQFKPLVTKTENSHPRDPSLSTQLLNLSLLKYCPFLIPLPPAELDSHKLSSRLVSQPFCHTFLKSCSTWLTKEYFKPKLNIDYTGYITSNRCFQSEYSTISQSMFPLVL